MTRTSPVINALALALVNLAGVGIGFFAFRLLDSESQLAVQLPVMVLVSVSGFVLWARITSRRRYGLRSQDRHLVFMLAFVWAAIVFVPLHFVTQGYLSAASNVAALWVAQALANVPALAVASDSPTQVVESVQPRDPDAEEEGRE